MDNPYVTSLFLKECKLENYEGVLGFENLNHLQVDSAMGFSQVDYSKLTNLKELALVAQRVEDYKFFFQKTSHLKDLSLQCCNLQNSDTRYLAYYMKDIECLNLYGTYVDDISFLKKLDKLEAVTLPLGVSDLDVLYEMPYLQSIDFDAYTELFVDEELTQFFDDNEIFYPYYDRNIREKVDNIVAGMNITEQMTDEEKILEVTETMLKIMTCEDVPAYTFEGTTLDICVNHGVGVCHDFSTIEYTLLKCVGIDAYLINGWALDYYGNPPLAHAWNEVCIDGEWYGIEPMWIDIEINDPSDVEFRESLWAIWYMKPTKTDDIYAWPENGDYTGSEDKIFALSHVTMNDPMDTVGQSGPAVEDKYTVEFLDDDGTVILSGEYEFGTSAADITPEDPSKDRDSQYTYEFSGWEPEVTDVEEDATYMATYNKITNEYKIRFVNEDGTELSSVEYPYGTAASDIVRPAVPAKDATDKYTYTFEECDKEITDVTGEATYKTVFKASPRIGVYYLNSITGDGKGEDIVITIGRDVDNEHAVDYLESINSDGRKLTVGEQCEVRSGSVVITLKKAYLDTLDEGKHKLEIKFKDGPEVSLEYTVKHLPKENVGTNKAASVPSTGERISGTTFAGASCIILAVSVVVLTGAWRKKQAFPDFSLKVRRKGKK